MSNIIQSNQSKSSLEGKTSSLDGRLSFDGGKASLDSKSSLNPVADAERSVLRVLWGELAHFYADCHSGRGILFFPCPQNPGIF